MRRALLALAAAERRGYAVRGDYVAVTGFDSAFDTAMVRLTNVPADLVGPLGAVQSYARALHAALVAAYAAGGLPMPHWRSWQALARKWPFLLFTAPAPAPGGRRPVVCLKPLPPL